MNRLAWFRRLTRCGAALLPLGCGLVSPLDPPLIREGNSSMSPNGGSDSLGGAQPIGGEKGVASSMGGAAGAPQHSCTQNADCGELSRCRPEDHTCVTLDIRDPATGIAAGPCNRVLGAEYSLNPNAVFIGAFAQLDLTSTDAQTVLTTYQMATDDFNSNSVGLRGVSGGKPSPLVVILCNNADADVPVALNHLINEVHVPAVLAAMDISQLIEGFNDYPQTFFVSTTHGSTELANVSGGRAWTMLGQPSDFADIYAALMPHVEQLARADLIAGGVDRPLRVAAITETDNAFEIAVRDAVLPRLVFNGLSASDPANSFVSREVSVSTVGDVVDDLYSEQPPDIVFSFASNVFTDATQGVMAALDQKYWPRERPVFVLSPENAEDGASVTSLLAALQVADHKNNTARVLGVSPAGVPTSLAGALRAYRLALTSKLSTASTSFGNYYDAFYFLAYAMYTSPRAAFFDDSVRPQDLAAGMRRLTDLGATPYDVGPSGIPYVFSALSVANVDVQLLGTVGAPDFNRDTGMRRETGSIFCFDVGGNEEQRDVYRFDRDTGQFTAVVSPPACLLDF